MGPSRVELASQDPSGLVPDSDTARHHDIVIRVWQPHPVHAETLADLSLEPVSLNTVHAGFDGNTEPRSGACPGETEKSAHPEALHFATLEESQIFGAEADPCGFGKIHPESGFRITSKRRSERDACDPWRDACSGLSVR